MDMKEKCDILKQEVEQLSEKEKYLRSRIEELKSLLAVKKRKLQSINDLEKEEAKLLEELV